MATEPASPVDPGAIDAAVQLVRRTLFRMDAGPLDVENALWVVALTVAVLSDPESDEETVQRAAAVVSDYTARTGAVVVLQAAPVAH